MRFWGWAPGVLARHRVWAPGFRLTSHTPNQHQKQTTGPATAVLRGVRCRLPPPAPTTPPQARAPPQRYYFEATLALASDAAAAGGSSTTSKKGRRVRGLRLGWALAGATLPGLLGHAEASVGWDGGLRRVYSNVRRRAWAWGHLCVCVCVLTRFIG